MINVTNLSDAMTLLIKDDEVFESLKTDFPAILADLITFKSNPNCTCRSRVFKFFSDELQKDPNILNKYVKTPESLSKDLENMMQQRNNNNYSGKIFKIENTDEAWKNLTNQLVGKAFRTFSVVEKDGQLWVYLL
jgi:hypothetical protein